MTRTDPQGDAAIRRTDLGNDAPLPQGFVPIDLLSTRVEGWTPSHPSVDLYVGSQNTNSSNFVRITIVLDGLVCPPGPIGLNGFGYEPYIFGDRPLAGFIELDIDDHKDSGGELMPIARNRYLANVARFAHSPDGSIAGRMAQSGEELDSSFFTGPRFEQSGAEFSLVMCGCSMPSIVSQDGDMDSIFENGETWIIEGRFFERFESFQPLSGLFGGSAPGLFNPMTTLRFSHDPIEDRTTVTLVFPITNKGASMAAGEPEEDLDPSLLNHTSIEEALDDLIYGADMANGALHELTEEWRDQEVDDFREPSHWGVTALIGTLPTTMQPSSFYVWTDTGFNEHSTDFNLDELNDAMDSAVVTDFITLNDGGMKDDDHTVNGAVGIADFGIGFHFYDTNYDGVVSEADLPTQTCVADFTGDGALDFFDIAAFLSAYSGLDSGADLNGDGSWDFFDIAQFLSLYSMGCP